MTEPALPTAPSGFAGRLAACLSRPSRATLVDAAVIVAAWLVGVARVLRTGLGFDDVTYATPAQKVTLEAWRQGRFALWSNTTFGGTPHLGNVQTAALYPGNLLAAPFPDLVGPHVELSLHLLLFGVGFYLLGRRLCFARPAPAVMAAAAMLSGATAFRAPLLVHFPPLAWVPLAAVCVHAVVTSRRPRRAAAALAIAIWCILTSGHPQSVLMAFTLLGAWAVGLVIEHRAWRRIGWFAGAGALSLAMAAPMLFALRQSLAVAASSTRGTEALLNPGYVVPLRVFPRILLGEPFSELVVLYGIGERITYAGAVIVALSLVGTVAVVTARRWSLLAIALVGVFAATLSLGPRSPTMRFARAFLPGFDQPRVSARWNWVLAMAIVILAGAGIDRLRRSVHWPSGAIVAAAVVLTGVSTAFGVDAGVGRRNVAVWIAAAALVVVLAVVAHHNVRKGAACLLAALAILELGLPMARLINAGSWKVTDTSQLIGSNERWLAEQSGLTQQLINGDIDGHYVVAGLRPNANTLSGVRMLDGYDGGVAISRRWHAALLQVNATHNDMVFGAQLPLALDPDTFARLGIRFVLYDPVRGPAEDSLPGWVHRESSGYFQIYENPAWRGDVTAWHSTEKVKSPEAAGNTLRTQRGDYQDTGLVERSDAVLSCSGSCAPTFDNSTSSQSGERDADVRLDRPAIVAFTEQFDEGWTATVDGRETEVTPVDGVWAGVAVPAGNHHIELRYEPSWLVPSIVLMLLAWLSVTALWFWPPPPRPDADAN